MVVLADELVPLTIVLEFLSSFFCASLKDLNPFSGASAESVLIHWETEDFFAAALAEDTKEEEVTEADDDSTEFVTADTHLVLEVLVKELTESTVPLDSSDDSAVCAALTFLSAR